MPWTYLALSMTLGTLENVKFGVTGSQLSQICTTSSVSPSVGCSFNLISIFKALIRCFGSVLGVCSLGAPEVFLGSIAEIRGLFLHPFPEDPAGQKDGVSLRVTSRQLQIQPSLGQWQSKQKHKPSGSLSFDFLETRIFYGFLAIPLILYTIFLTKSKAYTFSLHCCSEISFYPSFRHHCLAAVQRGPTLKAVPQDMEEKQETWARTGQFSKFLLVSKVFLLLFTFQTFQVSDVHFLSRVFSCSQAGREQRGDREPTPPGRSQKVVLHRYFHCFLLYFCLLTASVCLVCLCLSFLPLGVTLLTFSVLTCVCCAVTVSSLFLATFLTSMMSSEENCDFELGPRDIFHSVECSVAFCSRWPLG